MDLKEARTILGIDAGASREEIEAAWRTAIKQAHPDPGQNGDGDRARALNEARDVAVGELTGTDVVVREIRTELERFRSEDTKRRKSEQAIEKVVMHHVGDLAFRKRQRVTAAIVSGGAAAVLAVVSTLGRYEVLTPILGFFAAALAVVGAMFGLLAWSLSTRERMLEIDIEEVGETLSDRAALAGTLDELELGGQFSREDLRAAIDRWEVPEDDGSASRPAGAFGLGRQPAPLAGTAKAIGPVDFGRLLLAKGIELGLLTEEVSDDGDGARRYGYRRV